MNGDFPQTYSVEPDMTATPHGNIDELIIKAWLQELEDAPFERYRREFTKIDPRKLANLVEQLDFSATGFSKPEERKEYILRRLKRGDKPGGVVSYKTPGGFDIPEGQDSRGIKYKPVGGVTRVTPRTKLDQLLDFILPQTDPDTTYHGYTETPEEIHSRINQPDYLEEQFGPDAAEPSEAFDEELYYGMSYEEQQLRTLIHEMFHLPYPYEKYPGAGAHKWGGGESQEWYDEFAEEPLLKQIKELYPTKEGLRKLVDDLLSPIK